MAEGRPPVPPTGACPYCGRHVLVVSDGARGLMVCVPHARRVPPGDACGGGDLPVFDQAAARARWTAYVAALLRPAGGERA
jgi:hypothetical protein